MGSYAGGLGTSSSGGGGGGGCKRSRDDYTCDDDGEKLGVNKVARAATWDSPASATAADASSSSAAAGYGAVEQAWVSALLAAPPPPSPPPPLLPPSAGPLNFQQRVMAAAALQEIRGAGGGIQRPPLPRTGTMNTSPSFEASPSSFGDSDLVSSIRAPLVLPQNGLHQQQSPTGVLSQQGGILSGLLQQGQQQQQSSSGGSLHHQQQQPVLPLPPVTPLMPPLMARDPASWFSTGIKDQSPASSSFQDLVMPPFSGIGMSSSLPPPIQQQSSLPPPPPAPAPALSSQQACDLLLDHLPMPPSMTAAGYGDSFPSYGGNLLLPSIAGCSSSSSQGRNNYHVGGNTHNSCSNNANNNVAVNSSASKQRQHQQQQQQQYHQHHQLANGSSYCSSEIAVSSITSVHNNNNGGASSSTSMHNGSPDEHHHGHHAQQHQNQQQQQQQQPQQRSSKQAPTRTYTKVYKLGSIGRAVDVTRFNNYTELRWELARMFGLEGQLDPKSGWQLVFIDHEGDILLVGDDPWEEFVTSVRGIRILSPSEVSFYTGNDTSNTGLAAGGGSSSGGSGGGAGIGGGGGGGGVGPSSHSCLTSGLF